LLFYEVRVQVIAMWWSRGNSRVTEGAKTLASPMIMSLEPRMLFDGAVAATVADAAQPDAHPTAEAAKTPVADQPADSHAPQGQVDATQAAVPGKSVVFVDSRVKDSASLLEGVAPGTQVVQRRPATNRRLPGHPPRRQLGANHCPR
jgi:hypothetical protein